MNQTVLLGRAEMHQIIIGRPAGGVMGNRALEQKNKTKTAARERQFQRAESVTEGNTETGPNGDFVYLLMEKGFAP